MLSSTAIAMGRTGGVYDPDSEEYVEKRAEVQRDLIRGLKGRQEQEQKV